VTGPLDYDTGMVLRMNQTWRTK